MSRAAGPPDTPLARVDVAIVNYNAGDWLARCIESLRPDRAGEPNVIVVDNGSSDASLQALDDAAPGRDGLTVDRLDRNTGFAAGVNRAAGHASREFLLILNPDCLLAPAVLARLVEELDDHPEAALVSGKVLDCNGKEQRGSRRRLPTPRRVIGEMLRLGGERIDRTGTPAPQSSVEVEAVSGACMLVRRNAFVELGGMDERYPLHFEDLDLFARLRAAGWTLRWVPGVEIVHAGGRSSGTRPVGVLWAKHRGLWRYLARHCGEAWPAWQRPLWFVALILHAAIRTPVAWAAGRFGAAR